MFILQHKHKSFFFFFFLECPLMSCFQNLASAQQVLAERLATKNHAVEISEAEMQQENKRLRAKLSGLEGRSRRNNIKYRWCPCR